MGKIFISYRRSDSADATGRIYDRLIRHFSRSQIFKDVDNIPAATNYKSVIMDSMRASNILLLIIGRDWVSSKDEKGNTRLLLPEDPIRFEIEHAISQGLTIFPVLVENAKMPEKDDLPESIQSISFQNAVPVRPDPDFDNDIKKLVEALEKTKLTTTRGVAEFGLEKGGPEYHQWEPPMLVIQWQNKQQVVLYPPEAATGKIKR